MVWIEQECVEVLTGTRELGFISGRMGELLPCAVVVEFAAECGVSCFAQFAGG